MSVLRRAYVEVEPDVTGFDTSLKEKLSRQDPGGKAGKQVGGQLNRALKRFDLDPINVKANPKDALAGIAVAEARLRELADESATVEVKVQTERALRQLSAFRKQLGGDEPVKVIVDPSPAQAAFAKLGGELRALGLDPIDIEANPVDALAAIKVTQDRLKAVRDDAGSIEVRLNSDRVLVQLAHLRKQLADVGDDSAGGFAAQLGAKLGPLLAKLPIEGPLGIGVAAAGVAAAPLLASVIAGAVLGEAGIGGVVGGLAVAAKDARVKAAVDTLGERLEDRLESAGAAMVQPALLGLGDIEHALDTIDINRIFRDSAKLVPVLAAGVSSAIVDLGDGLEELVHNAGPVIGVISQGIAEIGSTVGSGLASLADNGPQATAALTTLFEVISSGIGTTLTLVNILTELYGISQKIGGDFALQTLLKITGAEMDNTGFSAKRLADSTDGAAGSMQIAVDAAKKLAEAQKVLKPAQDAVTSSQQVLQHTLDSLSPRAALAKQNADALRTAYQNLYGVTQSQTEANESYQASFDNLAASVKANAGEFKRNKDNLDLHTAAGRSNRDALEDLLTKSNELYFADIAAGTSIAEATKKHQARTAAVEKEANKVHLNKGETDKLIATYGRIPGKKTTDLVLDGVKAVAEALDKLYRLQRALALGININLVEGTGTVKDFKAAGGYIRDGLIPGPPSGVDNVLASTVYGDRIALATGEFIVNAQQTQKHRPLLEAINAGYDGYASGGLLSRVDTSRSWPFEVNAAKTHIMSQAAAEAKVIPAVPKGQTLDFITRVVHAAFPGLPLISGYRPGAHTLSGALSYHALRRAADYPPSRPLAEWVNQHYRARTKELITPWNDLNIHNGQRHQYTGAVWNQHNFAGGNAHDHWALAGGGLVRRDARMPLFDGGGTLMPGINTVVNGLGRPEPLIPAGAAGDVHIHIHNSVIATKQQAVDLVVDAYNTAKKERKIR